MPNILRTALAVIVLGIVLGAVYELHCLLWVLKQTAFAMDKDVVVPFILARSVAAGALVTGIIFGVREVGRLLLPLWLVDKIESSKAGGKDTEGALAMVKEMLSIAKDAKDLQGGK